MDKIQLGRLCLILLSIIALLYSFVFPSFADESVQTGESSDSVKNDMTFSDLAGLTAGVMDGTVQDQVLEGLVDNAQISYYTSVTDECIALAQGKVDYVLIVREQFRFISDEYPDIRIIEQLSVPCGEVGFIFRPASESDVYQAQLNEYIRELEASGELERLRDYWLSPGDKETVILPDEGENGILTYGTSATFAPFDYIADNMLTGFEPAILKGFGEKYGYGIKTSLLSFSGIVAAAASGKTDICGNCIISTEERRKSVDFSEIICEPLFTIIMRAETIAEITGYTSVLQSAKKEGFFEGIQESIRKTFIDEDRWKLILSGCSVTVSMTLISGIAGTGIGFLIYLMLKSRRRAVRAAAKAFNEIMSNTPIVVLLMIFYYILFGSSRFPAFWVAVITFSLNFGAVMSGIYYTSIESIDSGQMEAALSLGYPRRRAFRTFILPQAALRAMPLFKTQIVALLKGTAIVGYISIQDLTKMGDIIRTRTYEAFFPLIAIALIYFLIAVFLKFGIGRLEKRLDPELRRKRELNKKKPEEDHV